MLREPDIHSKPVKHIVVEGSDHPKTVNTIETAIYLARAAGSDRVSVVQEDDTAKLALIRSTELSDNEAEERKERITSEDQKRIDEILKCTDCGNLNMHVERLEGKPGFMISKYARENGADLLMLSSPNTKLGLIDRVFPHDIEFALADLPCDLMIVHPKTEDQ
jgi:nucleotide-binding universal stress UspA family protein